MLKIGHRGWRGNFPENSMTSVENAIELGVDGIEIDIVVNGQNELVVSHDPWMCETICSPGGVHYNLYDMHQQAIEEHDCGQIPSKKFPHQARFHSTKPLLRQLIKEFDWRDLWLFLEVKSRPEWDDLYHPNPHEYSDLIVSELADFKHLNKVYFMSFDSRILELIQSKIPNSKNLLLFDQMPSEKIQFNSIGPNHKLITRENLRNWKMQKLEVFAWTVNELEDIQKCKSGGIDGIISDYPNRLFG